MKKVVQAIIIATILVISTVAPNAVSKISAATFTITDYVLEKDGKLYAIDSETYVEMKGAGLAFLKDVKITHVKSSEGDIYELDTYLEAKAGISNGTMDKTLQLLHGQGFEADVQPGKVVIDGNGDISLEDSDGSEEGPVEDEFKVLSIE